MQGIGAIAEIGIVLWELLLLLGRHGRELGLWKDNEDDRRLAAALGDSHGTLRDLRVTGIGRGGRERDVLISAAAFERDGKPLAVLSVRDISETALANLEYEKILHHAPTFHGDTLYAESEILEVTPSKSKADRGVVYVETRALNQKGERVLSLRRRVLIPRRPG